MKINVSFKELCNFYMSFEDDAHDELNVGFGEVSIAYNGDIEEYTGEYDVYPKISSQILETKDTVLTHNIKVFEIPYASVSNNSGGMTATIGGIL